MATTIPNFISNPAKIITPTTYSWSSCWEEGKSPDRSTDVVIGNMVMLVDTSGMARNIVIEAGGVLMIKSGKLLVADTIHIKKGGTLICEDKSDISFHSEGFHPNDTEQMGCGIIVQGTFLAKGKATSTHARLTKSVAGGTSDIPIDADMMLQWEVGDYVALTPSPWDNDYYSSQPRLSDKLNITSRYPSSISVYEHIQDARFQSGPMVDRPLYPHVASLSRSILLYTGSDSKLRAHIIVLDEGYIELVGVQIENMGRTDADKPLGPDNAKGRYAVHLHHLQPIPPNPSNPYRFTVRNCAILDSRKWAIAVHDSHNGMVCYNVIRGAQHAGIVTEEGSESYNYLCGNFICDIANGHGIWLVGVNNYVNDNVIAGCWGNPSRPIRNEYGNEVGGYGIWMVNNTSIATQKYTVPRADGSSYSFTNGWQGILECRRNEFYLVRGGIYLDHRKGYQHIIENALVWGSYGNISYGIAIGIYDTAPIPGAGLGVTVRGLVSSNASIDCYSNNATTIDRCKIVANVVGIRDFINSGNLTISDCRITTDGTCIRLGLPSNAGAGPLPPLGSLLKKVWVFDNELVGKCLIDMESKWDANTSSRIPLCLTEVHYHSGSEYYRLYWREQDGAEICPALSSIPDHPIFVKNGCPETGLTNQQAWDKYRLAVGGAVAPQTGRVMDPRIKGIMVLISSAAAAVKWEYAP